MRDVLEVGKVWCPVGDRLEVLNRELDVRRASHGEQVKDLWNSQSFAVFGAWMQTYGVGRATKDVDDGDRVEEGVASEDIPEVGISPSVFQLR